MGRSRAIPQPADDDANQGRGKRKRTAQNLENIETAIAGLNDGKKASYHCNYCNKDISGKIRIKCVLCSDFDLCVECFSVGAEVHPHKSNHPYRVMDNLSFPLICPEWNADEEILLLEGTEMYGLGNWNEVAEHVGTKSRTQCIDHYNAIYMNSPCFPLPDMSHVMGKGKEELLAMAKQLGETRRGFPTPGEVTIKEESPLSAGIKPEDQQKEGVAACASAILTSESGFAGGSRIDNMSLGGVKSSSITVHGHCKDGCETIKVEDIHSDRSIGEKKPRTSVDEVPSMKELSGYNSKRQEFDVEYDNDAEQLLADMEFKETDTDGERELKLRVLRIYSKRLDERKHRKDFILERNLLYPDPFDEYLTPEEKEICNEYRVFTRFHSKEEHEEFLKSIIEEHRLLKRIQDLQEARVAGCRTSAEAETYIEDKRKQEAEEKEHPTKETSQSGFSSKYLNRLNNVKVEIDGSPHGGFRSPISSDSAGKDSSSRDKKLARSNSLDTWDVTGFLGADILSDAEKQLCGEIKILPTHYLNILETMAIGILNGKITKKSDAHGLFNIDSTKVDKVYDMLVKKGIAQA